MLPVPPCPHPRPPGLGPRDLAFTNPKGERLVGVLVEAGSDDVVILCHGCARRVGGGGVGGGRSARAAGGAGRRRQPPPSRCSAVRPQQSQPSLSLWLLPRGQPSIMRPPMASLPTHPPPPPALSYVANMSMCQFPRVAAALAAAGLCSFRFDHACAIFSQSQRRGPFLLGNHDDEVGWGRLGGARVMARGGCSPTGPTWLAPCLRPLDARGQGAAAAACQCGARPPLPSSTLACLLRQVADMAAACEFMRSLGKRVVCLLGHRCAGGGGGAGAVRAARVDPALRPAWCRGLCVVWHRRLSDARPLSCSPQPPQSPAARAARRSKGGMNSVIFAARHHDVPRIVNLAGRFRPRCGARAGSGSGAGGWVAGERVQHWRQRCIVCRTRARRLPSHPMDPAAARPVARRAGRACCSGLGRTWRSGWRRGRYP